ncbi:MAG: hypothetical protein AB7Q17_08740 [Phycisphaerae bacterium]
MSALDRRGAAHGPRGARRARVLALPAALSLGLSLLAGCLMRVTQPERVDDPVTAYLTDYGYHASVLLPREDGQLSEFAFGQWDWFALNHNQWYHALGIVLLPSGGTLGTRVVTPPRPARTLERTPGVAPAPDAPSRGDLAALDDFAAALWCQRVWPLRVERSRAAGLRDRLQAEYDAARHTEVYNPQVRLTLVRSDKLYWHHQNCNTVVAQWLEALGCEVTGARGEAEFDVKAGPRWSLDFVSSAPGEARYSKH